MGDELGPRAWGRGRGRGRAQTQGQEAPAAASGVRPAQEGRGYRPGAQAPAPYARPPGPHQQQPQVARPPVRGVQGSLSRVGRTGGSMDVDVSESVGRGTTGGGDTAEASSYGRGAIRGRRPLLSDQLITRPRDLVSKKGVSGYPLTLTTNYFEILAKKEWCLYQYHVDFCPEEDRIAVRKGLLRLHKEKLGGNGYIFDGSVLFTSHPLQEKLEFVSTRQSDEAEIKITIRFVTVLDKSNHTYVQFFNILMRKFLHHLKLQQVGRNYFDPRAKIQITEYMLELWPGYITAIKQHDHGILMCAEISHKVMRKQSILNLLEDARRKNDRDYRAQFLAEVIGMTVLTDYNNNTYRIDDVNFDLTPESTFERGKEKISYIDYYRTRYQIQIRQRHQPLLLSQSKMKNRQTGSKDLVYLVPELCRATGLTDEMKSNFNLMKSVSNHTRIGPQARIQRLMTLNSRLHAEPAVIQDLTEWDLKLERSLLNVQGRLLNQEQIVFGRNKKIRSGEQADWASGFRGAEMFVTTELKEWVLVVTSRSGRDAEKFFENLSRTSRPMGFNIKPPKYYELREDRAGNYTDALENIMSSSKPQLIMCVVPNNRADRYSAIKKKCCVDRPVCSQVVLAKNLNPQKGGMSIATKIAIQLNCKIGGAAWSVEVPSGGLMVVGFDVCHDTVNKNKDIGAMVASLDKSLSRYYSAVTMHRNGEELSNNLSMNLVNAVQKYQQVNKALPTRIILYRDGVSDGEIPYVYSHEGRMIREKLAVLYGDPKLVKMAIIIVTKRVNTRLFANGNVNPPPGTVVDDGITDPARYDFFIVSQFVRQGAVAPTSYNVISDNVGLDADKLQRFTYKMCHMYFNWAGTVSVPAPCQYAHKLAFLVGQYLHQQPSTALENLLYFL
ncbi:piwi-like protein Siwi isoform X2 [Cephus cinctus]|uniref:Piwi-like protein Siwi isoform X2 n=1 Tax=Cephus cinctus TaxID=211228 RepID=A0AAJ7FM53_CEPCN|nr:piwi-like protein Siwi isoform X2 [Cephus cinctus]